MSFVVNGLGSSPKKHLAQKKMYAAALDRDIKMFRKELMKAKKSPKNCRVAGRALLNVGFAAGASFSEMKGVSRKASGGRPTGAAVSRMKKALSAFDKVCIMKKKPAKKGIK
jgi:hypothetical protein